MGATQRPDATPHLRSEQVILRNASSDLATARYMLSLACSSRRTTGKRSIRSYSIGLLALIYAIIFMTAGIFSNRAVSATSTNGGAAVLARSEKCGIWNDTYFNIVNNVVLSTEEEFELQTQWSAKVAHDVQVSLETVVLDTGYIDSHIHLGINSESKDRLTYRRNTTCAILDSTGYVKGWDGAVANASGPKPAPGSAYAYYGPSLYKDTNWTYSYANFASYYDLFSNQISLPYQLDVERAIGFADPQWTPSDFQPISEVAQKDSDLNLLFLSFTGMYLGEIGDPWFSAHKEQTFDSGLTYLEKRYARDEAISVLGCTEQHQFCTNNGTCTGFRGFDQVQNVEAFNNALTPHQNATFDRMLRAVANSCLAHVIEHLAVTTTPMLASSVCVTGTSGAVLSQTLPDDQWETELQFWHSIAMAQVQRGVVQWGTGQIAPSPQHVEYLLPPTTEQDIWFCKNLIVPSTFYQSFSVMAISLLVAFGTFVIIVSLTIERLAAFARRCFRQSPPQGDWEHDNMLGIQSLDEAPHEARTRRRHRGHFSASRSTDSVGEIELTTRPGQSNKHRISSQVLPQGGLSFDFLNVCKTPEPDASNEIVIGYSFRPGSESSKDSSLKDFQQTTPETPLHLVASQKERRTISTGNGLSSADTGWCDFTETPGSGSTPLPIQRPALVARFEQPRRPPLPPEPSTRYTMGPVLPIP
ncbi:hypothetical protein LTR20_007155 [Exophiala xenobiotica]|nr:hypothetical protein LTS06_011787 [Exophiala xenobiotica]KAK5259255.1 hypothetical protein LTR40_006324 [Exophiala xenobiotica]KAK5380405.1 hypothetical protein LTS13_003262 [Exophiala xenobiotica]KAK5393073.1 hypothetical protein LTR79_009386 [Exophiala xenobiotica]KAK5412157.1 hypothetical protein LTR90_007720 [Exophiala xenobiotica]